MIEEAQFGAPVERLPGAGLEALSTYTPKRLPVALWAVWRDRVIDLAGHMHPDHAVNARNIAAAICEAIRESQLTTDASLESVLSDANILLVINEANRRGLKRDSVNELRLRLEAAKAVHAGFTDRTSHAKEDKTAPVGRLEALAVLSRDLDSRYREAAARVLADVEVLKPEPWPCPLEAKEWERLRKELRKRGYTSTRWRWSEVKNERIRQEFCNPTPVVSLLPLIGSPSRLEQIFDWTAPDVQPVACGLRGSANLSVHSWTVEPMPVQTPSTHHGLIAKPARTNRAAMKRLAARARAQQTAAPAPRSEKLEQILATWHPRNLSEWEWANCKDLAHDVMRRATHITGVESFRKHLRLVTEFINWAFGAGYDLELQELFLERVIDDYMRRGIKVDKRTAADYRVDLRNIAAHINMAPGAPNRSLPLEHNSVKPPDTDDEVAHILRLIELERNTRFKRRIQVAVALGLGAGRPSGCPSTLELF